MVLNKFLCWMWELSSDREENIHAWRNNSFALHQMQKDQVFHLVVEQAVV